MSDYRDALLGILSLFAGWFGLAFSYGAWVTLGKLDMGIYDPFLQDPFGHLGMFAVLLYALAVGAFHWAFNRPLAILAVVVVTAFIIGLAERFAEGHHD